VVRYSRQVTYNRIIKAVVGVVDGGIGVNWEYLGFEKEEFKSFLHEFLEAMGFLLPRTVHILRNGFDDRVDWNRPRISREECELAGVIPEEAVVRARRWLSEYRGESPGYLRFDLGPQYAVRL